MGTLASVKIIPMIDKQIDPGPAAVEAKVSAVQAPDTPAPVAAEFPCLNRSRSRRFRCARCFLDLLGYVTRERIIAASLACISIGALFLVWYLGTKYKFEILHPLQERSDAL